MAAMCVLAVGASWGFAASEARAQDVRKGACEATGEVAVLASPITPWKGAPLRVLLSTEKPLTGELTLTGPDGKVAVRSGTRFGGPPYFWSAEVAAPSPGVWTARLTQEASAGSDCPALTQEITVQRKAGARLSASKTSVWPIRASWDRANENLYSAWIEKLFDAPLDEAPSWKALHEVLRDPGRNVLFNHLNLSEDQKGHVVRPDCADLPYFLRAYFAFKMGLPFGYAKCTRGGGGKPPRCAQWWNIEKEEPPPSPPPAEKKIADGGDFLSFFGGPPAPAAAPKKPQRPPGLVAGFGYYLGTTLANGVHSGSGRTAAADNATDYYPIALTQETLRPGTIYADPYGHILVLTKRVAQTGESAGLFLAVDGQPDGTVARKRFWRGNFLFAQDPALGGPGFKRFRPVVRTKGGQRRLTNAEIAKHAAYGDVSLDAAKLSVEDFYDRMDDVMSPAPLDPVRALTEAIAALDEQVRARVTSVENGRKYQAAGKADVAMPDGAAIFETTGAWEDFATPSRDLRLLIAIDVVRGFPERVARRPERYAMPAGKTAADIKAELERVLAAELKARTFSYTRSDGSPWTLTLGDVLDRMDALEVAYNINDCAELRWGAREGSAEAGPCKRRASQAQRSKMSDYRVWFSERRRPPRG